MGTGKMGTALARAFAAAGHSVVAWNRTPARAEPLRTVATLASTPATAARDASLLVASLTDYGVCGQVLFTAEMGESLRGKKLYSLRAGHLQTPAPAPRGRRSTVCTISMALSSRNRASSRPIMRPCSMPATGLCSMHTNQPFKRRRARGGAAEVRVAGDLQHRSGFAVHERGVARAAESRRRRDQYGRQGRWIDNVFIERLWRSVKYEEVYPRSNVSMMIMRPPQHGQRCECTRSSALVDAGSLSTATIFNSSRARAMFSARAPLANRP
jgi:hypothetical protein